MTKKMPPIKIKPSKEGSFTAWAKKKGFSTKKGVPKSAIEAGLHSKDAAIRKKANFANNARKWNKGG